MAEKKSVILYCDAIEQWNMLTDEQAGMLIKALLQYGRYGKRMQTDDGMLALAFSFMSAQIDRDSEKWEKKRERNAANYKRRKNSQRDSDDSVQFSPIQHNSDSDTVTVTDTVTDTVTGTDTVTDTVIEKENKKEKSADKPRRAQKQFVPPTVEEVQAYCRERENSIDPQRFVDFYTANGWVQGKGKPIRDWKAALRLWEQRETELHPTAREKPRQDSSFELADFDRLVNHF